VEGIHLLYLEINKIFSLSCQPICNSALNISRNDIHKLGTSEANLTTLEVDEIILTMREIALQFSQIAQRLYPHQIRESTLQMIQSRIQQNIDFLTET